MALTSAISGRSVGISRSWSQPTEFSLVSEVEYPQLTRITAKSGHVTDRLGDRPAMPADPVLFKRKSLNPRMRSVLKMLNWTGKFYMKYIPLLAKEVIWALSL